MLKGIEFVSNEAELSEKRVDERPYGGVTSQVGFIVWIFICVDKVFQSDDRDNTYAVIHSISVSASRAGKRGENIAVQ